MRPQLAGTVLAILALAGALVPTAASSEGYDVDAYLVKGAHAAYGEVSGYLQIRPGELSRVWLSGELLLYFRGTFTFTCEVSTAIAATIEECSGSEGKRFAGAYAIDNAGNAAGPAAGAGTIFGFRLVAYGHT